jgi:hypothetical protein
LFYCPKCGKELKIMSETLGICSTCGHVTPTNKPAVATTPSHPSGDVVGYCKKCGRAVTSDAKFCEYCGTPIDIPVSPISQHVLPSPEPTRSGAVTVGHYAGLVSRKLPLKLLAVALIALIVGFGIGASSFRTSPGLGYITVKVIWCNPNRVYIIHSYGRS